MAEIPVHSKSRDIEDGLYIEGRISLALYHTWSRDSTFRDRIWSAPFGAGTEVDQEVGTTTEYSSHYTVSTCVFVLFYGMASSKRTRTHSM